MNGHLLNNSVDKSFPKLYDALSLFFKTENYGILTCNEITVSVSMKLISDTRMYIIFDSHSRGKKGCNAPKNGSSFLGIFKSFDKFCRLLLRNFSSNKNCEVSIRNLFNLTPTKIDFSNSSFSNKVSTIIM